MNFFRALSNLLRFDRTNWKALTLCFFAAAIFWMFNALNKNYATNVNVPLHFEFDNKKFVVVEPLPAYIALNVSGNGWELLRKSLGVKVPAITMPIERPAETRKIVASSLAPIVASQLGTLKVNYIVTDTLRLSIEPSATRKIKLVVDLKGVSFKKGFGRTGPVLTLPDSVTLDGPKSFIESLSDTLFLNLNANKVNSNINESVEVVVHSDFVNRNPPVAEVIFEVGNVEEIVRLVKLITPKAPWGTEIADDSVRCIFMVPEKFLNRFLSEPITLTLSLENTTISKGETKSFLPSVKNVPDYAEVVHID